MVGELALGNLRQREMVWTGGLSDLPSAGVATDAEEILNSSGAKPCSGVASGMSMFIYLRGAADCGSGTLDSVTSDSARRRHSVGLGVFAASQHRGS